jgi:membrane carboxypeptidase/penicillin-binding protein PbpC
LAVGEAGTFIATHINGDDVHGHQFFVNDVAVSNMSMSREFAWTPEKAGTFDVTVLVDDGFSIGEATMQINVE